VSFRARRGIFLDDKVFTTASRLTEYGAGSMQ
jgi:hypothetical protein